MKRIIISILLIILVLTGIAIYYASSEGNISLREVGMIATLALIIAFAVFLLIRRIRSFRKNLPAEDELSKKVMRKAGSTVFYISLYLWLIVLYISDKTAMETYTLIGTGIMAMAVIFALSWIYYNYRGKSET